MGDVEEVECLGGDAPLTKTEVFGTFGGVFGDIPSGVLRGQLTGRAAVDGLGVELIPEAQHEVGPLGHRDGEPHVSGGLANRLDQPRRVNAELWRLVVLPWSVEANECMEVDHATTLELCHLHERHSAAPGKLSRSKARCPG